MDAKTIDPIIAINFVNRIYNEKKDAIERYINTEIPDRNGRSRRDKTKNIYYKTLFRFFTRPSVIKGTLLSVYDIILN